MNTALVAAKATGHDVNSVALERLNARVVRRLRSVNDDKRAETRRLLGSKEQWHAFEVEFRATVHDIGHQLVWPEDVARCLRVCEANGQLSGRLLKYFEANGDFYIDEPSRGPWMRLRLGGSEWQSTGLSESQVLAGSPRLAFLILATVIDYNLSQAEDRREPIEYVERMVGLFRQEKRVHLREPLVYFPVKKCLRKSDLDPVPWATRAPSRRLSCAAGTAQSNGLRVSRGRRRYRGAIPSGRAVAIQRWVDLLVQRLITACCLR